MSDGREYTPFLRPYKCKEVDGVYRSKETGKILVMRNTELRGFIDCEKSPEEPYDAYWSRIQIEGDVTPKRTLIEPYVLRANWEKVIDL